jgi:hypothetical protein
MVPMPPSKRCGLSSARISLKRSLMLCTFVVVVGAGFPAGAGVPAGP